MVEWILWSLITLYMCDVQRCVELDTVSDQRTKIAVFQSAEQCEWANKLMKHKHMGIAHQVSDRELDGTFMRKRVDYMCFPGSVHIDQVLLKGVKE